MDPITKLINRWRQDATIGENICAWRTIPAQDASFMPFPNDIHPALVHSFEKKGIKALYSHQSDAWELTQAKNNLVVVTNTASGKTLCYTLPVLNDLLRNEYSRALFLFPTKALTQDQLFGIQELLDNTNQITADDKLAAPVIPAIYDGDTPGNVRHSVRENSRLVLSNPDMLHTGILPYHPRWSSFFRGLNFVVVDEMHTYRGVFGSHVANIIRRLKRIAHFYGTKLQFILTSATIGNPKELAEMLIEEPVVVLDNDHSARGTKHFLVYNPPIINADLGLRASMFQECARLTKDILSLNIQTIVFGRSRRTVEVLLNTLRANSTHLSSASGDNSTFIRAYRSGYLPKQRREIETDLRDQKVKAVVATTALELGIDIGKLGAAILIGYPGTIAGMWQQAGRAGRGLDNSLALLIASTSPLDQFLAKQPEYLFDQKPEKALINPDNLLILLEHIKCAAFELPFHTDDPFGDLDGKTTLEFLEFLWNADSLHKSGQRYFWMNNQFPAAGISLRNVSADRYLLQDASLSSIKTIGEVDGESALWMVHPQAIYLHEGETYLVTELDLDNKIAYLHSSLVDYYTKPRQETEIHLLETTAEEKTLGTVKAFGDIKVITRVVGYQKLQIGTHENLGIYELSLPESNLLTSGYLIKINRSIVEALRQTGMWSNDSNNYGPSWETQRKLARQRDNYQCQVCGSKAVGKAHHVHHKIPFRAFASLAEANSLRNLITLCPACHQRAERSVRINSGLAGLSYILGNLAPLFLMCDGRDLGVHQDPKSPLNEGEPLIVIYDRVPGGVGFSQSLFQIHSELLLRAYALASSCECTDGCPSCVGPGGELGYGGKTETVALLKLLIS